MPPLEITYMGKMGGDGVMVKRPLGVRRRLKQVRRRKVKRSGGGNQSLFRVVLKSFRVVLE